MCKNIYIYVGAQPVSLCTYNHRSPSSSSSSSCRAATRISLTLSRHFSLSFITSSRSSGLHPVSSHSCCRPAFARLHVCVHRSKSLMSSSLILQQCPACLVRLTWIVFMMGNYYYILAEISSLHIIPILYNIPLYIAIQYIRTPQHSLWFWSTILYSLKYAYKSNRYVFPSTCNDDVLFLSYNHLHIQK